MAPIRPLEAPKCFILYTPEAAVSGILHSMVAWLRVLSLDGLDHLNRRQKSSSSWIGTHESCPWRISTRVNVPSVRRSFLGQADQKTTVTVSPLLKVEFWGTSELTSPNLTPRGVLSTTTGVSKPICLSRRSGGCGPGSTGRPLIRAVASFWNSWM